MFGGCFYVRSMLEATMLFPEPGRPIIINHMLVIFYPLLLSSLFLSVALVQVIPYDANVAFHGGARASKSRSNSFTRKESSIEILRTTFTEDVQDKMYHLLIRK